MGGTSRHGPATQSGRMDANAQAPFYENKNRKLGLASPGALELFVVTAWGVVPSFEQIVNDFPNIVAEASNLNGLRERLEKFN